MTIYQYDGSQKTPKNYVGFRVAVSVNGTLRQKWYKETTELPKEAKDLERQWKFEQQLHRTSKIRDRKEKAQNSAYITGVSGIKMKFITTKRTLASGKVRRYYTPVFVVSGCSKSKRFLKYFNIKTSGFDMAWFKACHYAAEKYGETLLDKMLRQKPSVQQFQIIYRWQKNLGMEIPTHRLPNELL
jgi:hypothetical protein